MEQNYMIDSHDHQEEFILTEHIDENVESLPVKLQQSTYAGWQRFPRQDLPILFTFNETMKL